MRALRLFPLALIALGCTKTMTGLAPETMVAPSPEAALEYQEHLTLAEIEHLKPQLQFPITLAVTQPSSGSGWSAEEIAVIESLEEPLREQGFLDELVVLPESLSESCGWRMSYHCGIGRSRRTAARFQADALLLISLQTEVESRMNPASILNLTIVGLWLAPGHVRDATTIVEGSLVDNRNEYLYAFARAYGTAKLVRPYVYANWKKASKRSRLAALKEFGRQVIAEVSKHNYRAAQVSRTEE